MPDRGCLILSLLGVTMGTMFFLFPNSLLRLSKAVNRALVATPDELLLRYRYLVGLLCFVAGYGVFKLALLMPANPLTRLVQSP